MKQICLLEVARRAGHVARRVVEKGSTQIWFWKLCVAQDDMARRAVEKFKRRYVTATCALRR
ncbi:hypothetical protein A2U01_0109690, partial [Trifolium medium]|nr:hypothetical protein [Trifolium medium]